MGAPKKSPAPDARRDMAKELAAAAALKHQLREAFGEETDIDLVRDMVEGETELNETIDCVLKQMALDVASVQGLEKFETTLAARRKRISDRVETMRSMLLNALDILEQDFVERPIARLTKRKQPPKLLIVDESAIPTQFFKQPDPELSKADLTAALKNRRDTLEQKIVELNDKQRSGELDQPSYATALNTLLAAFPPIPGAELDNGGVAIQVKWS